MAAKKKTTKKKTTKKATAPKKEAAKYNFAGCSASGTWFIFENKPIIVDGDFAWKCEDGHYTTDVYGSSDYSCSGGTCRSPIVGLCDEADFSLDICDNLAADAPAFIISYDEYNAKLNEQLNRRELEHGCYPEDVFNTIVK